MFFILKSMFFKSVYRDQLLHNALQSISEPSGGHFEHSVT